MSRRTSPLQKVIAVFVAIAFLIGTAYITGEWPFKPEDSPFAENSTGDKGPQSVDGSGGTYRFDNGVVVTVPKGAVDGDTTLSVGAPKQSPAGGTTPLAGVNRATVAFDVTLAQGDRRDIQPHKALDITVPLEGAMLPAGTSPSQALLYTGVGTGYRFVPATVQGNVLKASLNHLSPKYITYVDEDKFAKAFGIDGSSVPPLNDCKSEVTANKTGKVTFGSGNNGWSNTDKDTPIYACLVAGDDGNPRIGIVNKRYYVLSVATSNDVTVETSPGDTDEELAKAFARTVFPNKKIAAFLGRDGRLVATTPSGSLPARVQLKADPNTFLAESGVFALTFTAGILTGKDSDDLVKTVKALLDIKDVTSCLQQTLDISTGKFDFGFDDAVDLVTSKCMSTIGEALGMPSNPWDLFGKWFQTVGSGLLGGLKAIRTSYEGIRMQTWDGKPPVTVQVESTLNLSRFIGEWYVHGTSMTVSADGTGTQQWNSGPCEEDLGERGMCTGHSTLKLTPLENGFKAVRTSVWYTDKNGDRYTPWSVREYDADRKAGESTIFSRMSDTLIKTLSSGGDGFGNPYMCRSNAPEQNLCGA